MEIILLFFAVVILGMEALMLFYLLCQLRKEDKQNEPKRPLLLNPMKLYRQKEALRERKQEQDRLDIILRNIENYDGTGDRQEDVPVR